MKKLYMLLAAAVLGTMAVGQSTIYVDIDASGNNDGSSWTNAYNELQNAISSASVGDEIWVAEGTYYPTHDIIGNLNPTNPRTKTFLINKNIAIYGGFTGAETMLSQRDWSQNITLFSGDIGINGDLSDNCTRVVFVTSTSSLDGVYVQDAYVNAAYGGGININGATFSLTNCEVSNNASYSGAGLYIQGNSEVSIDNCEFLNNTAENKGGGIFLEQGSINVLNSIFDGNEAGYGGGMSLEGGTATECKIVNCLFSNNQTTLYGGTAIFAYALPGGVKVVNSTFAKNDCPSCSASNTGTIRSNGVNYSIQNSIIWNSVPFSEAANNLSVFTVNNSVATNGFSGTGNLSAYPLFTDTLSNDFTLQSTSVAIDAGDTTGISDIIPSLDLNGNTRYFNGIDIGAFESTISSTGVSSNPSSQIHLYPNPTSGTIQFTKKISQVKVYELNGRLVRSISVNSNQVDLSFLSKGMYIIEISSLELIHTERVIVE